MIGDLRNRHGSVDKQFLDVAQPDVDQIIRKGNADLGGKQPGKMTFGESGRFCGVAQFDVLAVAALDEIHRFHDLSGEFVLELQVIGMTVLFPHQNDQPVQHAP